MIFLKNYLSILMLFIDYVFIICFMYKCLKTNGLEV